jgi:uncharacterized repeat protein (TIGR01451 family)
MARNYFSLLVLLAFSFAASAQLVDWSTYAAPLSLSNPGASLGTSLATDASGNCFVAGRVRGSIILENDTIGDSTAVSFLAKYNRQGQLLWLNKLAGDFDSIQVKTDAQGNCGIMSWIFSRVIIGTDSISPMNNYSMVLAKFNGQGSLLWTQHLDGRQHYGPAVFDLSPQGTFAVTGYFKDSLTIGQTLLIDTISGLYRPSQYIIQLDPTGNVSSAAVFYNPGCYAEDIEMDAGGNVYIAGFFGSTIRFGNLISQATSLPSQWEGNTNDFLLKLSPQGTPLWLLNLGDNIYAEPQLELDKNGDVLLSSIISVGPDSLTGAIANLLPSGLPHYYSSVLVKFSSNGQGQWAKAYPGNHDITDMVLSAQGGIYLYGTYWGTATIGTTLLPATPGSAFLAKFDPNGSPVWAVPVPTHTGRYSATAIGLDSTGGYLTGAENISTPTQGTFTPHFYLHHFRDEANFITGRVFLDLNSNGTQDSAEQGWPNLLVQRTPGNYFFVTDATGNYTATADIGTSTVTVANPPLYHTVVPASQSATFQGYGLTDSANHFALQPVPGQQDLRVTLTSLGIARPGFSFQYQITYENVGTVPLNCLVILQYDSVLSFVSSTVPVTSQAGNTLTWNAGMLNPYEKHSLKGWFGVPVAAPAGYIPVSTAEISPLAGDLTPMDNTSLDSVRVVNSFDPNDKTVSHPRLTPEQASRAPWLTYTVRFQNTGTAPASIVRIDDQLSSNLNRGTLEVLDASHKYQWTTTPTGKVTFQFPNIHLPDSGANEAASHGFIKYRVRPKTSLTDGQEILNTAEIYFDFNAPVITNTVRTAIEWPPYLGENSLVLSLSPNPNQGVFEYTIKNTAAGPMEVQVYSGTGRLVRKLSFNTRENRSITREMNLSDLSSGLYLLHITQGSRQTTHQVIIEN